MNRLSAALMAVALTCAASAQAQTPEERNAARMAIAKYGDAVVTVLATVKVRVNQGGREVQNQDQKAQAIATVLDKSGLAVMSLASLDPSDVLTANLARGRGAASGVSVSTEPSDIRFRLTDGREVPARIVLRDKDLDLAFLRPMDKPTAPMPAVDGAVAKPAQLDLAVVLQRLPELAGWQATALLTTVTAIVEKPRTFYLLTGGAPGAPVFDIQGRFLGVMLRLKNEAAGSPAIVLPASEIRDVAKQAAE